MRRRGRKIPGKEMGKSPGKDKISKKRKTDSGGRIVRVDAFAKMAANTMTQTMAEKNIFSGFIDFKPFYFLANFDYERFKSKLFFDDDSIFIDLIKSELLNNQNLNVELNFKIKDDFKTTNLHYELEVKNLGVMLLHSNVETINYDTSFSFSGFSFDQITNITNLGSEISTPFQPYTSSLICWYYKWS